MQEQYSLDDLRCVEMDGAPNRYFFPDSNGAVHYVKEDAEKIIEMVNQFGVELSSGYDIDLLYEFASSIKAVESILTKITQEKMHEDGDFDFLDKLEDGFQEEQEDYKEFKEKHYIRVKKDWKKVTKQEYDQTTIGGLITDKKIEKEEITKNNDSEV